jgi:hypothetical protein
MGSQAQHEEKAASNHRFLDKISLAGFPDWTATVMFYRAVHLVEMMFAVDNTHSGSHTERNAKLQRDHQDVYAEYHPLYNFARYARYDCRKFAAADLNVCFQRLDAVEKRVRAYIAAKLK